MIDMPSWIVKFLPQLRCPKCGDKVIKENITSVGIRGYYEGKNKDQYITYVAIEHKCPKCEGVYVFDVSQCTMRNFVYEMMHLYGLFNKNPDEVIDKLKLEDEMEENDILGSEDEYCDISSQMEKEYDELVKAHHGDEGSQISDQEIEELKQQLNTAKTWRQTMELIGISDQDNERYLHEDEEEEGKSNESK